MTLSPLFQGDDQIEGQNGVTHKRRRAVVGVLQTKHLVASFDNLGSSATAGRVAIAIAGRLKAVVG